MKVVCFSPNDAVWRWTLPQAQFLEALKQRGDEIVYVYCDRQYSSFCMSMASSGVSFADSDAAKAAICEVCSRNSELVRSEIGVAGRALRTFLSTDEIAEADAISRNQSLSSLFSYTEGGIEVGRLALYETIIQTKSISAELSPEAEAFYRANFRNTLISARASRAMLDELRPDAGISYHTAYAYNRAFQRVFEQGGVPVWFLNASLNIAELDTHLVAAKSSPEEFFRRLLADWSSFQSIACSNEDLRSVADHLLALIAGGGFAYSSAMVRGSATALEKLGCPTDKKIVAAFLSSYDELLAADLAGFGWTTHNEIFPSQIEWVKWLFAFARRRPDIHLIVRVHPREFAINGKGQRSEHSYLLEAAFAEKPDNVSINLPSDGIAFYDLVMDVDVALIAWSSAGMDAGMLGVPVVTYAGDVLLFPRSLTYDAKTIDQYAALIDEALDAGWSFERARAFFRWAVLMLGRSRIDMTNGATTPTSQTRVSRFARRILRRATLAVVPWTREQLSLRLRPRRLRDAGRIYTLLDCNLAMLYDDGTGSIVDSHQEAQALKRQLRRIVRYVASQRQSPPSRLNAVLVQPSSSKVS